VLDAPTWQYQSASRHRLGAPVRARVVAAIALGLIAVTESAIRAAATSVSVQRALVLCLVAAATATPVAFPAGQAVAAATVAAAVLSLTLFHTLTVAALVAELVVLHWLAREGAPAIRTQAVAVCLSAVFLVLVFTHPVPGGSESGVLTLLLASLAPAAALAGAVRRAQDQARMHDAARQAAAGDLLEHVARGERARIARELHDVVAHHISMIAVQAETARMATPGMPAAGAQRLSTIGDTARSALTEMRRLLGILREDAEAEAADLRPQPGLEQLNELLDQTRNASGSAARLILTGSPVPPDPGVELAAYRIIQEALTNTRRHAPGAAVDVELRYTDTAVILRIRDIGPGPPAQAGAGGHGLSGMRERAAAVAGQLQMGAAPGGGFLVQATLPADQREAIT
jgi:signal transduction histidine kinase